MPGTEIVIPYDGRSSILNRLRLFPLVGLLCGVGLRVVVPLLEIFSSGNISLFEMPFVSS